MEFIETSKRFEDIPVEVLDFIDGYVFLAEESHCARKSICRCAPSLVSNTKQMVDEIEVDLKHSFAERNRRGPRDARHVRAAQG